MRRVRPLRVSRSRRARPPKKDAISPMRSATGPTRVSAAFGSGWRGGHAAIWPELSNNWATWRPRPRRLTMRSGGWPALGAGARYSHIRVRRPRPERRPRRPSRLARSLAGMGYHVLALAALAAGDGAGAQEAREAASKHISVVGEMGAMWRYWDAEAALAGGDLAAARGWADDAVSATKGCYLSWALTGCARVLMAQGESKQAESDAHDALTRAAEIEAYIGVPDILEVLADLAGEAGGYREAARLFGAAQAIRQRIGVVRFMVYEAGYQASVTALRDAMGEKDFDAAWAEGAALSTEEAIVSAQRGHGERKRPANGWASLTAAERDVVRLVTEGLANNDIATRLFVSPRTVQTHLTHVYNKLGLTSRVQLAQEAAHHA